MKKTAALVAFAAVAAAATLSYAGLPARTGVNGSLHDMNAYNAVAGRGNQDQYNRVCVFCHTPHNATVNEPGSQTNFLPLWGNELTQKVQDPYQWATPANQALAIDNLVGPSRLCMTCHDGTLAIDAHVSNGQANNGNFKLSGSRAIGSNDSLLGKTHPIGFSYDDAVAARNLASSGAAGSNQVDEIVPKTEQFATAVVASSTQGTYNTVTRNSNRTIASVLFNGSILTCATCHEVHNKENAVQDAAVTGATPNYFLYAKEKESLICLSCHIK